jgi:hypothetical protein
VSLQGNYYKNVKKSIAYHLDTHYNIGYTGIAIIEQKIQIKIGYEDEEERKKSTHVVNHTGAKHRMYACSFSRGEKK